MKKSFLTLAVTALPLAAMAQYTFDALQLSQTELRGTSRFMSMAGAFGALGGDISTLNQNPAGIGVYRSSDIGITLAVDANSTKTEGDESLSRTRFNLNNFGYVGSIKLDSETMPNFNWGFTYNRNMDYHRRSRGVAYGTPTSITNYLADGLNALGMGGNPVQPWELDNASGYDPYAQGDGIQWNQILAYKSGMILHNGSSFDGLGFDGVTGNAEFEVEERGHADEFTIAMGGNIKNKLYWGLSVGISDLLYEYNRYYGEELLDTYIPNSIHTSATMVDGDAYIGFNDWSRTTGTGYNVKIGAIFKPVSALRLGLAFHTPTYYDMKDSYQSGATSEYYPLTNDNSYSHPDTYTPYGHSDYKIRTPWRLIGSAAVVVGKQGIISADYEYVGNKSITIRVPDDWGDDIVDKEAKDYLKDSHIIRLGGELRVSPYVSLRLGYSHQTTNTADEVRNEGGLVDGNVVYGAPVGGCSTAYQYDRKVQHITAGAGYHYKNFYFDVAYVYKNRKSTYEAFPIDDYVKNVMWDVKENDHRMTATLGFRF